MDPGPQGHPQRCVTGHSCRFEGEVPTALIRFSSETRTPKVSKSTKAESCPGSHSLSFIHSLVLAIAPQRFIKHLLCARCQLCAKLVEPDVPPHTGKICWWSSLLDSRFHSSSFTSCLTSSTHILGWDLLLGESTLLPG